MGTKFKSDLHRQLKDMHETLMQANTLFSLIVLAMRSGDVDQYGGTDLPEVGIKITGAAADAVDISELVRNEK